MILNHNLKKEHNKAIASIWREKKVTHVTVTTDVASERIAEVISKQILDGYKLVKVSFKR